MKNKLAVFAVSLIMCLTCLLAGCTKADNATTLDIMSKFDVDVSPYLTTNTSIGSAIISIQGSDLYYYVFSSEGDLRQTIENKDTIYSVLKSGRDYDFLISHASKYFNQKFNTNAMVVFQDRLNQIPQEKLSKLWYSVDNTVNQISTFGQRYRGLKACFNALDLTATNSVHALEDLLVQYKTLIKAVLRMNLDTQDIIDNSLYEYSDLVPVKTEASTETEPQYEPVTVPTMEIDRMVDAFELYVTEYLFERYMAFSDDVQVNIMSNTLLVKMQNMVTKVEQARKNTARENSTQVDTYKYLKLVEGTMRNSIEANQNAVKILNGKVPSTKDSDYEYKIKIYNNFVDYEKLLISYVDTLTELI